jgi:hypothetical protein
MAFKNPCTAVFFNHNPNTFIVACGDGIFIVKVGTKSTQPFSGTPMNAFYESHTLVLSDDDDVLVAGNWNYPFSVCGYDTASLTRLWIYNTANSVGVVCMLGVHVLVTVVFNPTLVLDRTTGAQIPALQTAYGRTFGLGVIEGLCFILTQYHLLRPPHLRVPRHAAASPVPASQASPSAVGDVGLDREVPRVAVIGCFDAHLII